MKRPYSEPSRNVRGVGVDQCDWDAVTAATMSIGGSRAERRIAKRWLRKHRTELCPLPKEKAKS